MVAHNFKIPPKAPNRKPCGNCQACKRTEGYQPCEYVPKPSEPITPKSRLINNELDGLASSVLISFALIVFFLLGFIVGAEVVK